jgi:K+/H+ antiporter YhaU regulatory subunit KhtT
MFKKVIMGIIQKVSNKTKEIKSSYDLSKKINHSISLTPREIEFILKTLGESSMQIKQIDFIYSLIIKLQSYYEELKSNSVK